MNRRIANRRRILRGLAALLVAAPWVCAAPAHGVNLKIGWAVGENGTILATQDGGATWARQASGVPHALRSVWFVDAARGFAVGDEACILFTFDGGRQWNHARLPPGWRGRYCSVRFDDARTGWIGVDLSVVLRTVDGGVTWAPQVIEGPNKTAIRELSFADGQRGLAVGASPEPASPQALRTEDGGKTWSLVKVNSKLHLTLLSVSFGGRDAAWAVGQQLDDTGKPYGTVLCSSDGGLTWKVQWEHKTTTLDSVCFIDEKTGWATGYAAKWAKPLVLVTTNGGKKWMPRAVPFRATIAASTLADASNGWVVGSEGLLARTSDLGRSWRRQNSGTRSTLTAIHFPQGAAHTAL